MNYLWKITLAILLVATNVACDGGKDATEVAENTTEEVVDLFRTEQEELKADFKEFRDEIQQKLDDLQQQAESADAKVDAALQKRIDQLAAYQKELENRMQQINAAAKEDWQTIKTDISGWMEETKNNING